MQGTITERVAPCNSFTKTFPPPTDLPVHSPSTTIYPASHHTTQAEYEPTMTDHSPHPSHQPHRERPALPRHQRERSRPPRVGHDPHTDHNNCAAHQPVVEQEDAHCRFNILVYPAISSDSTSPRRTTACSTSPASGNAPHHIHGSHCEPSQT
jgi:hypothetical protein